MYQRVKRSPEMDGSLYLVFSKAADIHFRESDWLPLLAVCKTVSRF